MNVLEQMRENHMDYPWEVSLETQALCNAACTFCPYPTLERKGLKMSDELVNKIVDEMISWKQRDMCFSPFKVNEPLLDPRTIPLCEKINKEAPWIRLRLFTNGSALVPAKIDAIARLQNVEHLWISLNEHRPAEYEKLMGLKFDITARRLDDLHSREDFPHRVVLSTVGYPNEQFRFYCWQRWPKFQSLAIKKDSWLGYTEAQRPEIPDSACSRWFELSIMADGLVTTCCMSDGSDKRYNIGDCKTDTLHAIYNQPRWKNLRESLRSRRTIDIEDLPCAACSY